MSDTHETITDIIAEMRRNFADGNPYYAAGLPDRLEAAHKRERGDAAKLREALKAIGGLCDRLMPTWDGAIGRIKDMAEAALAAPARNCDLPEVAKDPWRAWLDDKSNWDEFGSPKLEIHDWLLAPATEKEGGGK